LQRGGKGKTGRVKKTVTLPPYHAAPSELHILGIAPLKLILHAGLAIPNIAFHLPLDVVAMILAPRLRKG
jgi:hypothetical protein